MARGDKVLVPPFLSPEKEVKKQVSEKRLKAIADPRVKPGEAKLPQSLVPGEWCGAELEIVAPGGASHEKRLIVKAICDASIEENVVLINEDDLRSHGVSSGTVVTVRPAKRLSA